MSDQLPSSPPSLPPTSPMHSSDGHSEPDLPSHRSALMPEILPSAYQNCALKCELYNKQSTLLLENRKTHQLSLRKSDLSDVERASIQAAIDACERELDKVGDKDHEAQAELKNLWPNEQRRLLLFARDTWTGSAERPLGERLQALRHFAEGSFATEYGVKSSFGVYGEDGEIPFVKLTISHPWEELDDQSRSADERGGQSQQGARDGDRDDTWATQGWEIKGDSLYVTPYMGMSVSDSSDLQRQQLSSELSE